MDLVIENDLKGIISSFVIRKNENGIVQDMLLHEGTMTLTVLR